MLTRKEIDENCPEGSWTHAGATINDDDKSFELKFGATQHSLDQITEKSSGYVYVFDKKDFVQRKEGGVEYVSHNSVKPILKIRVSKQDLPQNIEVTPEDK